MTTPAITRRPLEAADFGRLVDLFRVSWEHDGMTDLNLDRLRDRYLDDRPGWDRAAHVWGWGDALAALSAVWRQVDDTEGDADGQVEIFPAFRRPDLEDEVLRTLRSSAAGPSGRPVTLRVGARDRQTWKTAMLGRHGFAVDRSFHRMSRDLTAPIAPAVIPDGYAVRPLAGDAEVDAWCGTATTAFADHYGAPSFEPDERRRRMLTSEYVRAADLVAVDSTGEPAGVAWSFRERLADGSSGGHVNYVAVLPAHRGLGVARALLLSSLHELRALGLETALLAVDAGNETNALRLYESAGFTKIDAALVYLAQIG